MHLVVAHAPLVLLLCLVACPVDAQPDREAQRRDMVREIEGDVRRTSDYLGRKALDERVLDAMRSVPRHEFVPSRLRGQAYRNRPLDIGYGQTISQPYIVAIMTDLIAPEAGDRILEIGTGSGYQAAVLAALVDEVYTIEIIEPLGERAADDFARLGLADVHTRIGDGYFGWPEAAPFDGIVVTAAASHVPPPLVSQLKAGGRMVIPVGTGLLTQQLLVVEKDEAGTVTTRQILPVRFVPLTGEH
jgi:protein-L-isoaspartate(D-aspartate) O-methyltransferase